MANSFDEDSILITIGDRVTFEPDNVRNRMVMLVFMANTRVKDVLPRGKYQFNVYQDGPNVVTRLESLPGTSMKVRYRNTKGPFTASSDFSMTEEKEIIETDRSSEWLNPWNFVKFIAFCAFIIAWAWAAFE